MSKLTTEDEVRDALDAITEAQRLLDSAMTRLENRLYDDRMVDGRLFDRVEDAGWNSRNSVDRLAEVLRETRNAIVSRGERMSR